MSPETYQLQLIVSELFSRQDAEGGGRAVQ